MSSEAVQLVEPMVSQGTDDSADHLECGQNYQLYMEIYRFDISHASKPQV